MNKHSLTSEELMRRHFIEIAEGSTLKNRISMMRRRLKGAVLAVGLSVTLLPLASSADEGELHRHANIEKLIEITDGVNHAKQAFLGGMELSLSGSKSLTASERDVIMAEAEDVFMDNADKFVDAMIPIYEKYYTDDDVKGLISFYTTDLGRRVKTAAPLIIRDAMSASAVLGESLVPEIKRQVMKRFEQMGAEAAPSGKPDQYQEK